MEGYDFISQSVSELSAIGAPTRSLVVPLNLTYDTLMIAFGLGVWVSASRNRALRLTALMVAGNAVISLVVIAFFPTNPIETWSVYPNNVHLVLMVMSMFCFLLAIGFGAVAYRKWFRLYSLGILLTYLILAIFRFTQASQIPAGQSESLIGIQERTMIFGYLLWVAMLAIVLILAGKD